MRARYPDSMCFENVEALLESMSVGLSRAYTYIACPAGVMDFGQVQRIAREQIVHNLGSDRRPFDEAGMRYIREWNVGNFGALNDRAKPRIWRAGPVPGQGKVQSSLGDIVVPYGHGFTKILADGEALNLASPQWVHRGEVTAMALLAAIVLIGQRDLNERKDGRLVVPDQLNRDLEDIAARHGMMNPQPLDRTLMDSTVEQRQADLESFHAL